MSLYNYMYSREREPLVRRLTEPRGFEWSTTNNGLRCAGVRGLFEGLAVGGGVEHRSADSVDVGAAMCLFGLNNLASQGSFPLQSCQIGARALFRTKVDECAPQTQRVSWRIVGQPE